MTDKRDRGRIEPGEPPGVAILGYGAMAEVHAVALRSIGARLISVAGPDDGRVRGFAQRHGITLATRDASQAVEVSGVDVVLVATPSPVHAKHAELALAAGHHTLVEIPLALSLADGERLVRLASDRGLILGVCHTWAYHESFRVATAALEGRLPLHVVATSIQRRRTNVGWTGRERSWTDDLLWHHGGHMLDLTLRLLGVTKIAARSAIGRPSVGSRPLDYAVAMETLDGRIGSVALSYNSLMDRTDALLIVDDRTILLSPHEVRTSVGKVHRSEEGVFEAAVRDQDASFLAAVRLGRAFPTTGASILPTLRLQESIEAEHRNRRRHRKRTGGEPDSHPDRRSDLEGD